MTEFAFLGELLYHFKAAIEPQIVATLPEPRHASICKLGRVWAMRLDDSAEGYGHTCFHTRTLYIWWPSLFSASFQSHWLLKPDNCVNLLRNWFRPCTCVTGAWHFFHAADKLQARRVFEMAGCPGQHIFSSGLPADRPPAGVHRWTHPQSVFDGLCCIWRALGKKYLSHTFVKTRV